LLLYAAHLEPADLKGEEVILMDYLDLDDSDLGGSDLGGSDLGEITIGSH
jgi:uncharacterized protein YjbI with pentapeptide repeats